MAAAARLALVGPCGMAFGHRPARRWTQSPVALQRPCSAEARALTLLRRFLSGGWLVDAFNSRTMPWDYIIPAIESLHCSSSEARSRCYILLAAGTLATTQACLNWISRDLGTKLGLTVKAQPQPRSEAGNAPRLLSATLICSTADGLHRSSDQPCAVEEANHIALRQAGRRGEGHLQVLGGQIADRKPGL